MAQNKRPASAETIQKIYDQMGKTIEVFFPVMAHCASVSTELRSTIKKSSAQQKICDCIKIVDVYGELQYLVIQIACTLRAEMRADSAVEKRFNLMRMVSWSFELYNEFFAHNNNKPSRFHLLEAYCKRFDVEDIEPIIESVRKAIATFEELYSLEDIRQKRNTSVHFNIKTIYQHLISMDEESETVRANAIFAVIQPMYELLAKNPVLAYILSIKTIHQFNLSMFAEQISSLSNNTKPIEALNKSIPNMAKTYDRVMHTYNAIKEKRETLQKVIGQSAWKELDKKKHIADIGFLNIHLFLEIASALKAYLTSENLIEKRFNLIRINNITYDGLKKIYLSKDTCGISPWQYVLDIIMNGNDDANKTTAKNLDERLNRLCLEYRFKNNPLRDYSTHICNNETGKSNIPSLLECLSQVDEMKELSNGLQFALLFKQIIDINNIVVSQMSISEREETKERLYKPFDEFKKKVDMSDISEVQRTKILDMAREPLDKIWSIFYEKV